MKILITGASGRVGRELVRDRQARGDAVRALVLPGDPGAEILAARGVEVVAGSLTDRNAVAAAVDGVDAVAHLAAAMLWTPDADRELFDQNIGGTFNLLQAAVAASRPLRRFFLASSDEVYPSLQARYLPIDEQHPQAPYSFYGLTKEVDERIARYYHRAHGIPVTIGRFALIARAEEILRPDGWSGRFLFAAPMAGLFRALGRADAAAAIEAACPGPEDRLLLAMDEDGRPYEFHLCDVRDVVAGISLQIDSHSAVGEAFNLSGPAPFSYRVAVEALHRAFGLPYVEVRIPGVPIRLSHDISKARSLLGYAPRFDISTIISKLAAERSA
jgi:UDP-glucose 4-epimerase